MPKIRPILQGSVKFRDGKKWRKKYCVITLAPFNDAFHLYCFKSYDEFAPYLNPANVILNEDLLKSQGLSDTLAASNITSYPLPHQAVQAAVKLTMDGLALANKMGNAISAPGPIDEINGLERGLHLDNESNVVLLIGTNNAYAISLQNEKDMFHWAGVMDKRLDDRHFHVTLAQTSGGNKLSVGLQAILHVQTWRICLISEPSAGAKFICSWRLDLIESAYTVEAKSNNDFAQLVIEANASARKIKGTHKFHVDPRKLTQLTEVIKALLGRRFSPAQQQLSNNPKTPQRSYTPVHDQTPDSALNSSLDYASSSEASIQGSTRATKMSGIGQKPPAPPPSESSAARNLGTFDSGIAEMYYNHGSEQTKLISALDEHGQKTAFVVRQRPSIPLQENVSGSSDKTTSIKTPTRPSSNHHFSSVGQKHFTMPTGRVGDSYESVGSASQVPSIKVFAGLITANRPNLPPKSNTLAPSNASFEMFHPDDDLGVPSTKSSQQDLGPTLNFPGDESSSKVGIHKRLALLFHRLNVSTELKQNTLPRLSTTSGPDEVKRKTFNTIIAEKLHSRPITIFRSSTSMVNARRPSTSSSSMANQSSKNRNFYSTLVRSITSKGKRPPINMDQTDSSLESSQLNVVGTSSGSMSKPTWNLSPAEVTNIIRLSQGHGPLPQSFSTQTMNENRTRNRLSRLLLHQPTAYIQNPSSSHDSQRFEGNLKRFLSIIATAEENDNIPEEQKITKDLPLTHQPIYRFNKIHPRWLVKANILDTSDSFLKLEEEPRLRSNTATCANPMHHSVESSSPGFYLQTSTNFPSHNHSLLDRQTKFRSCSLEVNSLLSSMDSRYPTSANSASECFGYDCQGSCWSLCSQPSSEPVGSRFEDNNVYQNLFKRNSAECLQPHRSTSQAVPAKVPVINENNSRVVVPGNAEYCNVIQMQERSNPDSENHTLTEATRVLLSQERLRSDLGMRTSLTKDVHVTAGRIVVADTSGPSPPSFYSVLPEELRDPKRNYAMVDHRLSPSNSAIPNIVVKLKFDANSGNSNSSVLTPLATTSTINNPEYINLNKDPKGPQPYKNKGDHPAYVMTTIANNNTKEEHNSPSVEDTSYYSQRRHSHSLSSVLPKPVLNYAELVPMDEIPSYSPSRNYRCYDTKEKTDAIASMVLNNDPTLPKNQVLKTLLSPSSPPKTPSQQQDPESTAAFAVGGKQGAPLVYTELDFAKTKVMGEFSESLTARKGDSVPSRGHTIQRKSIASSIKQILTKHND